MKFGKLLKDLTEGNPQMSEQPLIRYKELKKHLKNIKKQQDATQQGGQQEQPSAAPAAAEVAAQEPQQQQQAQQEYSEEELGYPLGPELPADLSAEEQAFINMLNEDLCRFNRFFMDKEEDAVIKLQALADRIASAQQGRADDTQELKAALVDFHGEMVLLLHWSLLNYAAVVKILKKHDKQSGLLLRAPYLANVLQQPFYSTSIMSRLVKMAEGHIESLVAQEARSGAAADAPAAAEDAADAAYQQAGGGSSHQPPAAAPAAAGAGSVAAAATTKAKDVSGKQPNGTAAGDGSAPAAATAAAAAAAAAAGAGSSGDEGAGGGMSDTDTEELLAGTAVCARTRVALQTWHQLCSNASTPSTILPANSSQALVRALNVRQRWAKIVSMAPIMQQAGMQAPAGQQAAAAQQEGSGQVQPADEVGAQQQQQQQQQQDIAAVVGQKHKDAEQTTAEGEAAAKRQKLDSQ